MTGEQGRDDLYAACPSPDILVNNAGGPPPGDFREWSQQDWFDAVNANMYSAIDMIRRCLDGMVERRFGRIINISSVNGQRGQFGQVNYSAAKAGVAAMTVTWAKEFARYGIRVNTVSPGFIGTEMVRSMKPEALAKLTKMIPAGRIGEPDEIAHTVQYLVENDFVSGRNIEVDGAMRL